MTFIFFIFLFIVQIIMLIKAIRVKKKMQWKNLFKIQLISIISVVIYALVYYTSNIIVPSRESDWNFIGILIFGGMVELIYIIMIIICLIIKCFQRNKIINETEETKSPLFFQIIFVIFILFNLIDIMPNIKRVFDTKKHYDEIINYLNIKYGNTDYKIIDVIDNFSCNFMSCSENEYIYTVKNNNSNIEFEVIYNYEKNEIVSDSYEQNKEKQ